MLNINKKQMVFITILIVIGTIGMVGTTTGTSQPVDTDGSVVEINHEQTVASDGSVKISVKTTDSAGTTIAVEPEGFQVELSSSDGRIENNQIRFLDVSNGDSIHTVDVNIIGGENSDTAEIIAWVNAGDRTDAVDVSTSTIEIKGSEMDSDRSDDEDTLDDKSTDETEKSTNKTDEKGDQIEKETPQNNTSLSGSTNKKNNTNAGNNSNQTAAKELGQGGDLNNSTNSNEPDKNTDDSIPGFGFLISLAAFAGCGYAMMSWYRIDTKN